MVSGCGRHWEWAWKPWGWKGTGGNWDGASGGRGRGQCGGAYNRGDDAAQDETFGDLLVTVWTLFKFTIKMISFFVCVFLNSCCTFHIGNNLSRFQSTIESNECSPERLKGA